MSPNPIARSHPPHLEFSSHARFRMEEPDIDRNSIESLLTAPQADISIDRSSGNYVFRFGDYRIIVKQAADNSFIVTSIFKTDQWPN